MPRLTYHAAYEPKRAVRTRCWKYIRHFGDPHGPVLANCDTAPSKELWLEHGWADRLVAPEGLYDLIFDPGETANLAADPAHAEVLTEMHERLARWMSDTDDPLLQGPVAPPPGAHVNDPNGLKPQATSRNGVPMQQNLHQESARRPEPISPRQVFSMNRNWRYWGDAVEGCTQPGFEDGHFERVTLPHTNKRLPWHSFDDKDYQFVAIYRRTFSLPPEKGKRVFVDFDGVMTAATVFLNGHRLGEHRGGYVPFSFELTDHLTEGENLLAVKVDARERADIPPFGGNLDYLTFGGIYRDVRLRVVSETFIENVFAKPRDVLCDAPKLEVGCFLESPSLPRTPAPFRLEVGLLDGERVVAETQLEAALEEQASQLSVVLNNLEGIEHWDLEYPKLYTVSVRLYEGETCLDVYTTRTGFRHAEFTPDGFYLNGRPLKLRGLNRHQSYPFVGQAMPARVQHKDALILRHELKCNVVRTSHYPQSPHFLDACDELGLLVFEEIPGWHHIGDEAWQELACRDVSAMIRRDWNRPAIVLWGVRINESRDNLAFYEHTNAIARTLDDTRQTGGVRNLGTKALPDTAYTIQEDVFTVNDFNPKQLRSPVHPRHLNAEFVGHMFPTKRNDNVERVQEHVRLHAHIHNLLSSDKRYAGGIGWCAFDYNTHANFGSGDRICYHGVMDIFRIPKPAAGFYRSQGDPEKEVVLEPAFHWAIGDRSGGGGPGRAMISSNCDALKFYIDDKLVATETPDRESFSHLAHPPFFCNELGSVWGRGWFDLRIDGYLSGEKVVSKRFSATGVDRQFHLEADDAELLGDGRDATRVVFRVTDEFGAARPFATGAIELSLEGPGEIIGENPFALVGGVGAVWVRTQQRGGRIVLRAKHPVLGAKKVEIQVREAAEEQV